MNITQIAHKSKNLSVPVNRDLAFLADSQIPDWCFKKILHRGNPDRLSIVVLTELMQLQHNYGDNNHDFELNDCFAYFKEKFSLKKLQVLRATARLHKAAIIFRSFREVLVKNCIVAKELDLRLSSAAVNHLMAEREEEYA